jgi:hypothetical protein
MLIHKSHSKNDLIDLINHLNLKITFSHQDTKKDIQNKLTEFVKTDFKINDNYYHLQNKDGLITYLENVNPKKTLSTKEKQTVMIIAKGIIQYCKNNFQLEFSKYDTIKELQDDLDYVKQFGDIPSVRRACRLVNIDPKFSGMKFVPLISPQIQKALDDKKTKGIKIMPILTIRRGTKQNPIIVDFD